MLCNIAMVAHQNVGFILEIKDGNVAAPRFGTIPWIGGKIVDGVSCVNLLH